MSSLLPVRLEAISHEPLSPAGPAHRRARPLGYAPAPMKQQTSTRSRPLSPWRRRLIVGGFVAGAGLFIWSMLPKGGFPTDLTRIGQGQASLVLTMDSHYMAGAETMNLLRDLREEFGGSVQFLVASVGLPEGQAFVRQYQTVDGSVVLFDARGQSVARLLAPRTQAELRQALEQVTGR
jgi:hypothetical protein